MKSLVITPSNASEFKFVNELLNKLGIQSSFMNEEDFEDLELAKILHKVDKTKKVSELSVLEKLKM